MKKWIWLFALPLLLLDCKGKKKPITEETITLKDFIELFDEVKLPYTVADSSFQVKKNDTSSISYKTFTSLVPDTLLHGVFGKNGRPRIFPLGKVVTKNKETYLLLKAISPSVKAAYTLVFDKDKKFIASLPLLVLDNNASTEQTAVMDNKYSITTNRQYKAADGRLLFKKAAYAYISGAGFALILVESNEAEAKKELLNPIDTLPRKNKLAGDYLQNRLNMVSVRDSRKPGYVMIFVHFEKDEGGCKGELKGEAKIASPGKAVYRQPGDQCELTLNFSGNKVTISEEGCGSHRDIKCFFEGSFVRKPPSKASPKTSEKPSKSVKPAKTR